MENRKYIYNFIVYTNNLCYGKMKIAEFTTLKQAQNYLKRNGFLSLKYSGSHNKYGCCDIEKKRIYV